MILLLIFAFLAGLVTILSPCILPLLPIILSSTLGGEKTGKSRPVGVVIGFIISFTFFTLFLSSLVRISGIPSDVLRTISVIVIAVLGIALLIPQFQLFLEQLFSLIANKVPQGAPRKGFGGGILVGLSLGLLWTPCVGPILASVISLAITGTVTIDAVFIVFAYALGTAIPMFVIMWGGQNALQRVPWLVAHTATIQKVFGVVMILTAVAIFTNLDRQFQTAVLTTFPQYGTGLTKFEDIKPIQDQLQKVTESGQKTATQAKMPRGFTAGVGQKGPQAPELILGGTWFNLPQKNISGLNQSSLSLKDLRGKVVLVDFWTYSCINCQRTLPYLKQWWQRYRDKGLVIIGVHAPEFEFEKNSNNVRRAISDFQLEYPIMQDNDFATWKAYQNQYWPAKYFIDKDGVIRYSHFGEGAYDESERVIQELLKESGAQDLPAESNAAPSTTYARTPETYLGSERGSTLMSPEDVVPDQQVEFTKPAELPADTFAFQGKWQVMKEYAAPRTGSQLYLNFDAMNVYLVMRPHTQGQPGKVKVYLDGQLQSSGEDVHDGIVTVGDDRLYKLIHLERPGRHLLRLEFLDDNTEAYAFTFG